MTIAAESEAIPYYPLDIDMTAFAELVKILNALGNEDALAIFLYANKGISSSKEAIQTLDLTQKRFYSRLKDLIDTGLIEKVEGEYRHTALGKILHDLGLSLEKLLINKDKLAVINQLNRANIPEEEKNKLYEMFSIEPIHQQSSLRIILDFEELVVTTLQMLDKAKTRVYMAPKYFDAKITERLLTLLDTDLKMYFVTDGSQPFSTRLKLVLSVLLNKSTMKHLSEFISSDRFNYRVVENLAYTFVVVDNASLVEISNPVSDNFMMAFYFEDEVLAQKFIDYFMTLWNNGAPIQLT